MKIIQTNLTELEIGHILYCLDKTPIIGRENKVFNVNLIGKLENDLKMSQIPKEEVKEIKEEPKEEIEEIEIW